MIVGSKYTYIISNFMAETQLRDIPVNKLMLDLDNPRMYHHGVADSDTVTVGLKDEEIMKDILESSELPELIKSIQSEGVRDAILRNSARRQI